VRRVLTGQANRGRQKHVCSSHHLPSGSCRVALPFYGWRLASPRPIGRYPIELNHLGDHLRRRRMDVGLTRKGAATQLGTNAWSLKCWEDDPSSKIRERFFPAIIRFLGYNPLPEPTTFGRLVMRERLSRGWSRPRLAVECEADVATIRRIERDTARLAKKTLRAVVRVLKLDPISSIVASRLSGSPSQPSKRHAWSFSP
jgi:hypothetical protein